MKLRILVVNLNNLQYTQDCIADLLLQNRDDFEILLVDQNSSEDGTDQYLNALESNSRVEVYRNPTNIPLNSVWNWFNDISTNEFLCFLNNDIRLCSNFVDSTLSVFELEPEVGIVVHSTNHSDFDTEKEKLEYKIVEPFKNMQGWDYTIRKELFRKIPVIFKTYCGDDFLFNNVYERGYNMAYILNSPIIHYEGKSKKYMKTSGIEDVNLFIQRGYKHYLKINFDYSKIKPTFNELKNEKNI